MSNEFIDNQKMKELEAYIEQLRWERDIAISQLNDIGVQFGEKVDDVVKVVRCKDCAHSKLWCARLVTEDNDVYAEVVDKEHFCGCGERKQKEGF